jgi:hypothetical protein
VLSWRWIAARSDAPGQGRAPGIDAGACNGASRFPGPSGDDDVGCAQGHVPGGIILRRGPVTRTRLEQVGHGDEVVEQLHVARPVGGRQQGRGGEDLRGFGAHYPGVGLEHQVVAGGRGVVLDVQGAGQRVDVIVEGDLGLPAG